MPLIKSKSKKAFSKNVSELMHSGERPLKQALAIAFSVKRGGKPKKKKNTGFSMMMVMKQRNKHK